LHIVLLPVHGIAFADDLEIAELQQLILFVQPVGYVVRVGVYLMGSALD
jgi:hypothetical protein